LVNFVRRLNRRRSLLALTPVLLVCITYLDLLIFMAVMMAPLAAARFCCSKPPGLWEIHQKATTVKALAMAAF
jgi:hypothetical protein